VAAYYGQMSSFVHMDISYRNLKRLAFAVGLQLVTCSTMAQQAWFIFIQSENKQPFYARINDRIYSSSSIGYLTLSDLRDSTYAIAIGFAGNQYREETFSIPLGGKDHGYQLKKTGAQDWVLYNWQNQRTVHPAVTSKDNQQLGERKKDDGFAGLMAAVVNDSSVLYTSVIKKPAPKETDTPAVTMDSGWVVKKQVAVIDSVEKATPIIKDTISNKKSEALVRNDTSAGNETSTAAHKDSVEKPAISKLKEETRNGNKRMVFLDASFAKADTITIIIPAEKKPVTPPVSRKDSVSTVVEVPRPKAVMNQPVITKDTIQAVTVTENKKTDTAVNKAKPAQEKTSSVVVANSDCRNFATEHDVDKLRVKMLTEKEPSNRIFQAFKVFKTKCFTTKQVHALSELFDTDENRYKFFETAWPFVSDTAQFKQLADVFTDDFFRSRFRTLIRAN
jgi:Domain of unknown function (DUF4476)